MADRGRAPAGNRELASDRPAALLAALGELAGAAASLTAAVERHDLAALVAANERAEILSARVGDLANALTDADRARLDLARMAALRDRLDLAARRNAYLIERAWAVDAATMRLLVGLGRSGSATDLGAPDHPARTYVTHEPPGDIDRQA